MNKAAEEERQAASVDAAHETFRNELASIAPDGRRRWIYARQPAGRFYRARTVLSVFLLAFLFGAPFVSVRGLPLMMFNVIERKFVLFGMLFWPQDFYMVVLIALTVLVTLMVSTVTVGRVWCGWLCPQTVFMEMLFRKLEYLIDGSAAEQLRRNRGPWTTGRLWRIVVKQSVFFGLSFLIANVFLAYIIGKDALLQIVTDAPSRHLGGLAAITIFSLVFYAVFARFREQACVLACPYGRVMSSLIDRHTVTVTYDSRRGEPRGRLVHGGHVPKLGDCVDCHQCVTVCPTGIDIRHGIQMECVNCTACMDACDGVMQRLSRPTGLIRLTSHEAIADGRLHWWTPRAKGYATVWALLVGVVTYTVASRPPLDVLILRQPGTLAATVAGGDVANFYNVQVFNRSSRDVAFDIAAAFPREARVTPVGELAHVAAHSLLESRLLLVVPRDAAAVEAIPVQFAVKSRGAVVQRIDSSFVGSGISRGEAR